MRKYILLVWVMLMNSCYAEDIEKLYICHSADTLYPYLAKNGLFGYVDSSFHIRIQPQYKTADYFDERGYAAVSDSTGQYGVINSDNQVVIPLEYIRVSLISLTDFTVAKARESYQSNMRFWEWKFLPGFNILGGGSHDNRLFDTKVERQKTTLWALGDKNNKISSKTKTSGNYFHHDLHTIPLPNNELLIDGELYAIGAKGGRQRAAGIEQSQGDGTFIQRRPGGLRIIGGDGKPVSTQQYKPLDSLEFRVEDDPVFKRFRHVNYGKPNMLWHNGKKEVFAYPDFGKPLPKSVRENTTLDDIRAKDIIQQTLTIASVPQSDYFLFMGFYKDKRFYRFLDVDGNWHQSLPEDILFSVKLPTGDILWPSKEHYMESAYLPDNWKLGAVNELIADSVYTISIQQGKLSRQGIWDTQNKRWIVKPDYFLVYPLGFDFRQWAFQHEKGSLWGVIDNVGNVLLKPTYYSISRSGQVQLHEDGKYKRFYLLLPSLQELREKD